MIKTLFAIALLIAGGFVAWKLAYPSVTVRYRLTLEGEVDGKPVSGSGVIETTYAKQPRISPEAGSTTIGVRGEAVALDLGERGTVFAILKEGQDWSYGPEAILVNAFGRGYQEKPFPFDFMWLRSLRGKADIPLDKLWMLVRFRDINDPKSVEAVDPNDLAKSFGPGVKLLRATIEMTSDPVTTGIEKRLEWLSNGYPEKRLVEATGRPINEVPRAHLLTYSNFKEGLK